MSDKALCFYCLRPVKGVDGRKCDPDGTPHVCPEKTARAVFAAPARRERPRPSRAPHAVRAR